MPSQCENQPILQEIDALEAFEKKNVFAKFWSSMFSRSYPTSWWTQFATLVNRNVRVILRDPRLTIARFFQTVVLSVLIGLVFMRLETSQSVRVERRRES